MKALALAALGLAAGLSSVRAETLAGGAPPRGASSGPPDSATLAFYLPPVPPALGAELAPAPTDQPGSDAAPPELRSYLRDSFYVALSAQLRRHAIGSDLAYSLDSYSTAKSALQTELRARLDLVRERSPAAREAELRRFATEQTPRIVELENSAETLRASLSRRSAAQRELLRWQIDTMAPDGETANPPGFDMREFAVQTALMIATFGEGLSSDQRRWLHEVADEQRAPDPTLTTWAFLPEGSRVSLAPSDPVSPQLRQLLQEYLELHRQLMSSVIKAMTGRDRFQARPWQAAAPAQGRLAAQLEAKAEAIRELLVGFKDPALLPQSPAVPSALAPELARYRAAKADLQKQVLQRAEAAKQAGAADSAPLRVRQAIAEFTTAHQAEYAALDRSRQHLLDHLTALAAASPNASPTSPDALASTFNQSLTQLKSFWEYRDYQNAVIQPGLSPEQRRLLFEGALSKLDLPLPPALHPVMED